MALKQTRMSGRGCWSIYSDEMNVREEYRHWIEVEMRGALKRNEFHLYYQPQFSIIDGTVRGFEALIRWKHPTRGYIPPLDFIKIAEETGFITALGRWAIMQACRDSVSNNIQVPVAVNISPVQFLNGDIVKIVSDVLNKTGLAPHLLELEVTESTLIEDRARAAEVFEKIAALGINLAIDDFGPVTQIWAIWQICHSRNSKLTNRSSTGSNRICTWPKLFRPLLPWHALWARLLWLKVSNVHHKKSCFARPVAV